MSNQTSNEVTSNEVTREEEAREAAWEAGNRVTEGLRTATISDEEAAEASRLIAELDQKMSEEEED